MNLSNADTRFYGGHPTGYTPLNTMLEPRTPYRNDVEEIDADTLGVILQNGSVVRVERGDYERLRKMGWLGRWTARKVTGNNTYPSVNHGTRIIPLGRVVLGATPGEVVRYLGSKLDLRRENLALFAKGGERLDHSQRRAKPAPAISPEERRKVLRRMRHRCHGAAAATAATVAAVVKAAPNIVAAKAIRRTQARIPSGLPLNTWARRLVAKPASINTNAEERA